MSNSENQNTSAQQPDDTISLFDLVAVLARRWRLIFFSTFFAGLFIVALSLYTTRIAGEGDWNPLRNVYSSEVVILLRDPDSSGGVQSPQGSADVGILSGLTITGGGQRGDDAALALKLMTGQTLLDSVIEELDLLSDFAGAEFPRIAARNTLSSSLTPEFDGASGLLTVSFQHTDPVFAADVLTVITRRLEERFASLTRSSARDREVAIQRQLTQIEDEIAEARSALTSFQERYGVIDPQSQGNQTLELITRFRQQKFELELERQRILELVRDASDPQIRRIDEQIAGINRIIRELQTGFQVYSPISMPLDQVGPLTVRYSELSRDLALNEQLYATFELQLINTRIESQDTSTRFQMVEPPEVPGGAIGPNRRNISLVVTVATFFLAVFTAFILEYFSRAAHDPEERRKIEFIKDQFRFRKDEHHEA